MYENNGGHLTRDERGRRTEGRSNAALWDRTVLLRAHETDLGGVFRKTAQGSTDGEGLLGRHDRLAQRQVSHGHRRWPGIPAGRRGSGAQDYACPFLHLTVRDHERRVLDVRK